MTGTRPWLGAGSLSFSINRQGTVSTASPLCASAILLRQQNGLKRRSASAPARSYKVIGISALRFRPDGSHYDPARRPGTTPGRRVYAPVSVLSLEAEM